MNSGNIEVLEELRSGNAVRAFRAVDTGHDSPVIVKIFESPLLGSNEARGRIRSRVKRWQSLNHPAILNPLHVETEGHKLLLVLPFIQTGSLEDRLRMGVVSSLDLGKLSDRVSHAVRALHEAGIAHGNLKPTNLLFDDEGDVLLTDLDLGIDGSGRHAAERAESGYRAPELVEGGMPTPEGDQYSWALILLSMLTRRGPREALQELADIEDNPPSGGFRRQGGHALSRRVAEPFRRALSRDPAQRFGSVSEFNQALQVAWGYKEAGVSKPAAAVQATESPKPAPKRRGKGLRLVALFVLPLLCILGAVPAFSSEWGASLWQDVRALSSEFDLQSGAAKEPTDDVQLVSQDESLPAEWTETPQDSQAVTEPAVNEETQDSTEDGTDGSTDTQQASEPTPTPESTQAALTKPEATATPTPQPTEEPSATPTESSDQNINPNSCNPDPNHSRYCTPTPGS